MKKIGRTALAALAGLIIALVLLELSLRLIGYIHYRQSVADKLSGDEDYVVLTIGDSFTIGVGAPPQYDYPTQLEQKFHDKGQNIQVLNRGIGGQNTSQALIELEEQLEYAQPDLTLIMIGGANLWNLWGYKNAPTRNFLYKIRVYKLALLVWEKLFGEKNVRGEILEKEKYDKLKKNYEESKGNMQKEANAIFDMGMFFLQEKKIDEAICWFGKGITKYPRFAINYAGMGTAYVMRDDYEQVMKYLMKGEQLDPRVPYTYLAHYYLCLNSQNYTGALYNLQKGIVRGRDITTFYKLMAFLRSRLPDKREEIDAFLEKFPPKPGPNGMYEIFDLAEYESEKNRMINKKRKYSDQEILDWIKSDLDKMIRMCKEYGSKVIIQGYPINTSQNYLTINDLLRKAAKKHHVHYLNHDIYFSQMKNKKNLFSFSGKDEHPNQFGYSIMADALYDYITNHKLLKPENE